jgi:hypothetical protein
MTNSKPDSFTPAKSTKKGNWFYCGIVVTVTWGKNVLGTASLWGLECNYPESDNQYLSNDIAEELAYEAADNALNTLNILQGLNKEPLVDLYKAVNPA